MTSFEDWPLGAATFRLVFAAQSWHWVDREIRCVKAAEALIAVGTLALFWHRTDWHGESVRDDLEELYRRQVPELHARAPGFPGLSPTRSDEEQSAEIATSPLFTDVVTRTHRWSATLTADAFVELLLTPVGPSPAARGDPSGAPRGSQRPNRRPRWSDRGPSCHLSDPGAHCAVTLPGVVERGGQKR